MTFNQQKMLCFPQNWSYLLFSALRTNRRGHAAKLFRPAVNCDAPKIFSPLTYRPPKPSRSWKLNCEEIHRWSHFSATATTMAIIQLTLCQPALPVKKWSIL